jgi:hypothetical protein
LFFKRAKIRYPRKTRPENGEGALAGEIKGKCMKKVLAGILLVLGSACGLNAQENSSQGPRNVTTNFSDNSDSQQSFAMTGATGNLASTNFAGTANASPATPAPPEPAAKPKYAVFGDRDDYRWQLGVGVDYVRFHSSVFDSNMVGLNTTLTYFTNSWFGVEGSAITGFGPTVFNSPDHAKIFGGAGGIRIGGRRARWEPFGHALVGGSHLEPQTAAGSRSGLMALAGGGVDFRVHSRLSLRGEADWVYTTFFSQTQNSLQIVGGVVLHF